MRKELDNLLCNKYPTLFRERSMNMSQTCMCWGFEHGDGWFNILDNLCEKLVAIEKSAKVEIIVKQVKEKFGTLRFYFDIIGPNITEEVNNQIYELVRKAEDESEHTCELCGSTVGAEGQSLAGWILTLCTECQIIRKLKNEDH